MKLEVRCEGCGNKDLTYKKGKYGGFYCSVCDEICDVQIEEFKNNNLTIEIKGQDLECVKELLE